MRFAISTTTSLLCALTLAGVSISVHAAADAPKAAAGELAAACTLLGHGDLESVKFTLNGRPRGNSFTVKTEQSGAPHEMAADICFFYDGIEGGRTSANVTVERYPSGKGMREWLQGKNEGAAEGATLTRVDDALCEQGQYGFANPAAEDRGNQREQRYIACDRITDDAHIAVSFEVPADGRPLPEAREVKRLLDGVTSRLPTLAR